MHVKYNRVNRKNCAFVARKPKNMSLVEYNKGNDLQGIACELEVKIFPPILYIHKILKVRIK